MGSVRYRTLERGTQTCDEAEEQLLRNIDEVIQELDVKYKLY